MICLHFLAWENIYIFIFQFKIFMYLLINLQLECEREKFYRNYFQILLLEYLKYF